ncbi:SusC/RagA family TonB-linked outer membrane protein [Chitinophaga sp. SYP-B3965]|uniref:SusC/RagA family TonB-linked outer membrane protein n=1 Tax=Chitinophaga sp. SYP-B3965 TaxID=2663120 RepID=UPI001299BF2F|nr:SusC/RagA family TonB-linked outer membrane protein [Chitinophaga sp. SYP-B3965]MRG44719.1 SusC/RagA family TonB-linked outer membrane protein [Chitinophaga sp. SYP-B3965]
MKKIGLCTYSASFFMKAAVIHYFLTLAFFGVQAAPANGQGILDKRISLTVERETFKSVLQKISLKAGVKFSYTRNTLPEKEKVSLLAKDETLEKVFISLFDPFDINFEAIGSQVVLRKDKLMTVMMTQGQPGLSIDINFKQVRGTIKDVTGSPVPGVTVAIKGTTKGTSSDGNGNFQLEANEGDVLVFSAIGFKRTEIKVSGETTYTVVLETDEKALGEVVVTAMGIKRSPRSLGYAVQKVDGSDLTIAQAPTIAQGLMGKVAGLNISQASGGVEGGSARLVIRGNTTLTGDNRALIIVDGVAINNDPMNNNANNGGGGAVGTQQGADISGYNDWGTGLNLINPEDIESVTVLKGPAAAALYGARGANGVILVTRKKGEKRKGLGVDYSYSSRATKVYEFLDFQNDFGSGLVGSMWTADQGKQFPVNGAGKRTQIGTYSGSYNAGDYKTGAFGMLPYDNSTQAWDVFSFPSGLSWGPKFDNQPVLWYDGVERPYSAQPNNWKAYFPDGNVNQHNVSISGGGDFGTIRASYTRDDSKANILNSNYKSNIFNIGSSIKISKMLSADITGSYVNYNRLNTPPVGAGAFMAGLAYAATRDYRPEVEKMNNFFPDGSQRDVGNSSNFPAGSPPYPYYSYMQNSYWNIYKNNTTFNRDQLVGGIKLTADLTDFLTLIAQGSIDHSSDGTEVREYPKNIQGTTGAYKQASARNMSRNLNGMVRLYKDNLWGKQFNASLTGGVESYYRNDYTVSNKTNGNFISPFIFALNNGANAPDPAQETRYAKKINSGFGFLDLSYKNYLFLQITGRNDWSSTLTDGSNSYFYPSVNLSYVFSDGIAKMQEALPWLSFGKLSLSYAETGSDTDPYSIFNVLNTVAYNGQAAQTFPSNLKFPGVEPQRSRQYEIGLNLGMFNNRVNVEVTAYTMKTFNQILTNSLPQSSGFTTVQLNRGSLGNKGLEFIINASPVSTKDFTWSISLNAAHAQNKVLSLDEGNDGLTLGSFFGGSGVSQRVKVGENFGTIYGKDYTYLNGKKVVKRAVNPQNQQLLSYMVNGQPQAAGTQWVLTPNEVPIGNAQPFMTGGIANTFRYKNISLYFLADGKFGGDMYFGSYAAAMGNGLLQETVKERNGGGLPLTYPDGTTSNTGIIFDGVFADGKPNTDVVSPPWYYLGTYTSWNHLGVPRSASVFDNSWMKLREVALTYQVPFNVVKQTKIFQSLSLSLIGRDLFYIFTTIPKGLNPEGVNGIGNMQGIEYSSMPRIRSLGFTVKAAL